MTVCLLMQQAPRLTAWKPVISLFSVLKLILQSSTWGVCVCPLSRKSVKLSRNHIMLFDGDRKYGHFILTLNKKEIITTLVTKRSNSIIRVTVPLVLSLLPPSLLLHRHAPWYIPQPPKPHLCTLLHKLCP